MTLNRSNYFSLEATKEYMSVSQYKMFEECPAAAMAAIRGEYKTEQTVSLLIGSYVDAYFEGSLPEFTLNHQELFKRDGTLKAEFVKANEIITRCERDKLFMEYMSGRKQVIMTGVIEGVPVKIKIDSLHDDKIVDLKIMKDFLPIYVEEQGRLPWYEAWRYDLQGAVYREIVRQNTGKVLPFYLAAATKEKVTDIDVKLIGEDLLDFELEQFRKNVALYDAMKKGVVEAPRCEACDYCKETKVLTAPSTTEGNLDE